MFYNQRPTRRRVRSKISRRSGGNWFRWLRPTALMAFLALTGSSGSVLQVPSLPTATAQPQQVQPAAAVGTRINPEYPLDQPLQMLREAQKIYGSVQTYDCILISQERIAGKLQPENVMQMTFRKSPFSVYMKWAAPKDMAGQEVCFVQGRNQNKMRVLPTGLGKSIMGWMSIDINDPKVMQHSRHQITEAGFGNLIDRYIKCWEAERLMNKTEVNIREYEYNKRRCIRVETTHAERHPSFYCFRSVLYFDSETRLPVRMECYDWPRPGGAAEGDLLECFSYINLQFNRDVPDAVFMR